MTTDTVDDILEHYGVKGMKWGVRRKERKAAATSLVDSFIKKAKADPNGFFYIPPPKGQTQMVAGQGKDFTDILLGKEGKRPAKNMRKYLEKAAYDDVKRDEKAQKKEEKKARRR